MEITVLISWKWQESRHKAKFVMMVMVIRELPHKDTQTIPQLQLPKFSPDFSHLLHEYFHIVSLSTHPIIDLSIGYNPSEIRGKSASLSPSMISFWLVAFAPSQRAVFLSVLHGLLHFFVFLGLSSLSLAPSDPRHECAAATLSSADLLRLPRARCQAAVRRGAGSWVSLYFPSQNQGSLFCLEYFSAVLMATAAWVPYGYHGFPLVSQKW